MYCSLYVRISTPSVSVCTVGHYDSCGLFIIHSPVGAHLYVRTSDVFGHLHPDDPSRATLTCKHLTDIATWLSIHVNFDMVSISVQKNAIQHVHI